jgi:hypothetical protein
MSTARLDATGQGDSAGLESPSPYWVKATESYKMVTYVGLYYPFIHFRDEGWLKANALYWDSMRRIVPSGARVHDTDEVKRLIDDGFIQNKAPHQAAHEIAAPFRALIATYGDALQARFAVINRESWTDDPDTRLYAPRSDPKLAYVFDEKMDQQLLSDLFGAGLVTSRSDDPRWIGMHPKLVEVYMLSLAVAMARGLGAHPVTDQSIDHIAVSGLTMDRLAATLLDLPGHVMSAPADQPADREIETAMVSLALRNVMPSKPARLPAEKIVAFRRSFAEERSLFQAEVAKLVESLAYLSDVKDSHEMEQHLTSEYDKTLGPRVDRIRKGLQSIKVDTVESAIAVSVPLPAAMIAVLDSVGYTPSRAAGGAAAVALTSWVVWRQRQKALDHLLRPSPEAYLYRVGQLSTPSALADDICASSHSFSRGEHVEPDFGGQLK